MIIQEFCLSITPLGADSYWLRTEDVAPGVPLAEIRVDWPVDAWLAETADWYTDPLVSLLSSEGAALGEPANRLLLGKALGEAIFQGRLRDSWLAAQSVAHYSHKILRLRLGFKDSRLQRLPWELLHDSDRALATGADLTFARYSVGPGMGEFAEPLPAADQPLRALMVISAPSDQECLALRQEVQQILADLPAAADPAATAIAIELTILEQPGRTELVNAIEQGQFQVFHYAGHSEVSATGGDLYLVNSQTGLTERLAGEDLAGLLVNNHIRLAVLNSCRGAYTASDDAETGWRDQNLVQALVNRGVPSVIAMAERISDDVAVTFTQLFYRNLKRGYPIDLCLGRTRQGLVAAYGSDQINWMLPILYLHPAFDGYLYEDKQRLETLDPWLLSDEGFDLSSEVFTQTAEATEDETADLIAFLETNDDSDYAEDAAMVTGLLQQLSESTRQQSSSGSPVDSSPAGASSQSGDRQTGDSQTAHSLTPSDAGLASSAALDPHSAETIAPASGLTVSRGLAAGIGAAGAILGLVVLFLTVDFNPRQTVSAPAVSGEGEAAIAETPPVLNAISALNQGNTEPALDIGETLLEQGHLQEVESLILQASPQQREGDANVTYIEGRWHWQNLAQGTSSAEDAMRAWDRSVKADSNFVQAWVGLGFAHYELGNTELAIDAWQQAIAADADNLRDANPGKTQVANPAVANAYGGLAMAYRQLSQLSVDPEEQQDLRQRADEIFEQAIALEPALLQSYRLGWLWDPVAAEWQKTIDSLSATR